MVGKCIVRTSWREIGVGCGRFKQIHQGQNKSTKILSPNEGHIVLSYECVLVLHSFTVTIFRTCLAFSFLAIIIIPGAIIL